MKLARFAAYFLYLLCACAILLEASLQVIAWANKYRASSLPAFQITGRVRILAVGDSNTYGLYLNKSDAYPAQFEAVWNRAHPELPVEVINAGFPGSSSYRVRSEFRHLLEVFHPDVVLLMIGFNDFWTAHEEIADDKQNVGQWLVANSRLLRLVTIWQSSRDITQDMHAGQDLSRPLTEDELQWLMQKTGEDHDALEAALQRLQKGEAVSESLKKGLENLQQKRKAQNVADADYLTVGQERFFLGFQPLGVATLTEAESGSGNKRRTVENIIAISAMAHDAHVPIYLLTYPSRWGFYPGANLKIREAAEKGGLPLIDITPLFTELCSGEPASCPGEFFFDFHATAQGNARVAQKVSNFLSNDPHFSAEK